MTPEQQLNDRAERDDYIQMINTLRTDANRAGDELANGVRAFPELHQYRCRNFVRAAFAFIEGGLSAMIVMAYQRHLLMLRSGQASPFTATEVEELSKKVFGFNQNAERTFRLFAKAFAPGLILLMSGEGWEGLQRAIAVRNRLMHPKNLSELNVEADEISLVSAALSWLSENVNAVLEEMRRQDVQQIEDSVSELIVLKFGLSKDQGVCAVRRMLERVGGIPTPEQYADSVTVLEEEVASIMTSGHK